jgi:hypothetical protein
MPAVNMAFDHGSDAATAPERFQTAITQAQTRFSFWIRKVEWSDDRTAARLSGPGYSVLLTLDERQVQVKGNLPVFPWMIQARVRKFLAETLGQN